MVGTTVECLKHYLHTLPTNQKKIRAARQPFCDAVKCTHKTASSWARGDAEPIALQLVLVRVFLWGRGYDLSDMRGINALVLRCMHALAHNATTPEQLLEVLSCLNVREVYRVLRGEVTPAYEKTKRLKEHLDEVFPGVSASPHEATAASVWQQAPSKASPRAVDHPLAKRARVASPARVTTDAFKHQVLALFALAKHFVSDDVSDEARAQLRELFPNGELFELSNTLGALCTKTARNDYMEDRHGK